MENKKIRVAITQGDTNGIGQELIFKAFEDLAMLELCTPIIYGSPKVATYHKNALNCQANFNIITKAEDARDGQLNFLTCIEEEIKVELGTYTETSGTAALSAIDQALEDCRKGLVDALVTNPIDNSPAFHFSGLTRYLEDHTDSFGKSLDIYINDHVRIALATCQQPLKMVTSTINKESVMAQIKMLRDSMKRDFRISNPRIAVLALNPKAGEDGMIGTEEKEILAPTIHELSENGVQAFGPYASDEFFGTGQYAAFDVILAMYHDQGLTPYRSLTSEDGIVYTAGLPIIRTAPDQTCSMDIAGKGVADASALRKAIYLAIDITRNQIHYDEPLANPLKKLYKEKRDESEKVRFAIPKPKTPQTTPNEQ